MEKILLKVFPKDIIYHVLIFYLFPHEKYQKVMDQLLFLRKILKNGYTTQEISHEGRRNKCGDWKTYDYNDKILCWGYYRSSERFIKAIIKFLLCHNCMKCSITKNMEIRWANGTCPNCVFKMNVIYSQQHLNKIKLNINIYHPDKINDKFIRYKSEDPNLICWTPYLIYLP